MSTVPKDALEAALQTKQQAEVDLLRTFLTRTAAETVKLVEDSEQSSFGFSSPIIPYYSLFKLFGDEFFALPLPLGWDNYRDSGGNWCLPTKQIQTKNPYINFFTHPFDEAVAGERVGQFGRKKNTVLELAYYEYKKTVKGNKYDEKLGRFLDVKWADIPFKKKPLGINNTVLIPMVILAVSDIDRKVTTTAIKTDANGLMEVDDDGRAVTEDVLTDAKDFYIPEVGDIFETGKSTLAKNSPRYKVVFVSLSYKQYLALQAVRERYTGKMTSIKMPFDDSVIKSDYNIAHPMLGCVLNFSKKIINGTVEHIVKDIPLNGLLLEVKRNSKNKNIAVPTELGIEVLNALVEVSPMREEFEALIAKQTPESIDEGRAVNHGTLTRSLKSLPTLLSVDADNKLLVGSQINTVLKTFEECIENYLAETFPEQGNDVIGKVSTISTPPAKKAVPLKKEAEDAEVIAALPLPAGDEMGDEMGDDLPF